MRCLEDYWRLFQIVRYMILHRACVMELVGFSTEVQSIWATIATSKEGRAKAAERYEKGYLMMRMQKHL